MKRGDIVIIAASGNYGKPRPAVIVQTDAFPLEHASVIICQMTTALIDAADFRILIEPDAGNGVRERSQIMADKPVTIRRDRVGQVIGRVSDDEIRLTNAALAFALGLAD
jgi:mRNA interferase MazF